MNSHVIFTAGIKIMNEKSITNLLKQSGEYSFNIKQIENERDYYKHKSKIFDIDTEYIDDMLFALIEAASYIRGNSIENVEEWKSNWLKKSDKLMKYKLLSK